MEGDNPDAKAAPGGEGKEMEGEVADVDGAPEQPTPFSANVLESPNQQVKRIISETVENQACDDDTAERLPGMLHSPVPNRAESGVTSYVRADTIRTPGRRGSLKPVASNPATPCLLSGSVPGTPNIPSVGEQKDTPTSVYRAEGGDEVHPLPSNMSRFNRMLPRSEVDDEIHQIAEMAPRAEAVPQPLHTHLKARSHSIRSTALTERSEATTVDWPAGLARSNTERSGRSDTLSRSNTDRSLLTRSNTDHSLTRSNTDRTGLTISGSMVRSNTEQSLAPSQREEDDRSLHRHHSPRQWLVQGAGESYHSLPDKLNDSSLSLDGAYRSSEERLAVMVKLCRRGALVQSGVLDKKLQDMTLAVGKTGATGAFFTSRPVSAALAKWPWRLFLILLSCGCAALTVSYLFDLDRTRTGGPFFAFVPILLRNGTALNPWEGGVKGSPGCVADFKLLYNGCALQGGNSTWDGAMLHLRFDAEVVFNGYQFATASASPELDPVMYEIWESSASREGPWTVASFTECEQELPEERGAVRRQDWREGWRVRWMVTVLSYALATVLFLSGSVLAVANDCTSAKVALGVALLLVCSGYLASLSRTPLTVCAWDHSTYWWAISFSFSIALWIVLVTSILRESHHNLKILMLFGCALSATKLIELVDSFFEGSVWDKYWAGRSPLTLYLFVGAGVAFFFFPAFIIVCHWRVQSQARRLMQPDRLEYDRCWEEIVGMLMNRKLLEAIEQSTERLGLASSRSGNPTVRQMCRLTVEGEPEKEWNIFCNPNGGSSSALPGLREGVGSSGNNSPCTTMAVEKLKSVSQRSSWIMSRRKRAQQPIKSLDQLYFQAALMHPVLKNKVSKWAALSAGLFPIKGGSPRRSLSRTPHGSRSASVTHDGRSPKDESTMAPLESPLGPPPDAESPGRAARGERRPSTLLAEEDPAIEGRRLLWDDGEGKVQHRLSTEEVEAGSRSLAADEGAGVFSSMGSAGYHSIFGSGLSLGSGPSSSMGSRSLSGRGESWEGANTGANVESAGSVQMGAAGGVWIRPDLHRAKSMTVHKTLDRPPSDGQLIIADVSSSAKAASTTPKEFSSLPTRKLDVDSALDSKGAHAILDQGVLKASMQFMSADDEGHANDDKEAGSQPLASDSRVEGESIRRSIDADMVHGGAFGETRSPNSSSPSCDLDKDLELEAAVRGDLQDCSSQAVSHKGGVMVQGGAFGDSSTLSHEVGKDRELEALVAGSRGDGLGSARDHVEDIVEAAASGVEAKRREWERVSSQLLEEEKGRCNFNGTAFGNEAHTVQGDESMVKWSDLKSPDRAVEKAVRAYRGDVSQLVDVCRQCIIFENLADMLSCLEAIEQDGDIAVERVKNRLSLDYDPMLSAGYRDVALNIRIINPETLGMGIETHVSEVQLILLPFYELKTNEGHKRYVAFRNLRAE